MLTLHLPEVLLMGFSYLNNSIECLIYLSMWFYNIYEVSFFFKTKKGKTNFYFVFSSLFSILFNRNRKKEGLSNLFYVLFYRPIVLGFRSVGPRIYSLITSNVKDEEEKKGKGKGRVEKENKMKVVKSGETRRILA